MIGKALPRAGCAFSRDCIFAAPYLVWVVEFPSQKHPPLCAFCCSPACGAYFPRAANDKVERLPILYCREHVWKAMEFDRSVAAQKASADPASASASRVAAASVH